MSDFSLQINEAFEQAADEDLVVVLPAPNELQIDIDSYEDYTVFHNMVGRLLQFEHFEFTECSSKSGEFGKRHITVQFDRPIEPLERIALQACLGSDRTRELLSWMRLKNNDPHPTLFFEKPAQPETTAVAATDAPATEEKQCE